MHTQKLSGRDLAHGKQQTLAGQLSRGILEMHVPLQGKPSTSTAESLIRSFDLYAVRCLQTSSSDHEISTGREHADGQGYPEVLLTKNESGIWYNVWKTLKMKKNVRDVRRGGSLDALRA